MGHNALLFHNDVIKTALSRVQCLEAMSPIGYIGIVRQFDAGQRKVVIDLLQEEWEIVA